MHQLVVVILVHVMQLYLLCVVVIKIFLNKLNLYLKKWVNLKILNIWDLVSNMLFVYYYYSYYLMIIMIDILFVYSWIRTTYKNGKSNFNCIKYDWSM